MRRIDMHGAAQPTQRARNAIHSVPSPSSDPALKPSRLMGEGFRFSVGRYFASAGSRARPAIA